jgi:hypothetical protein
MRIWLSSAVVLIALQALPAHAERDPLSGAPVAPSKKREISSPITDRFYVKGSFFNPAIRTSLRVDTQADTPGTILGTEKDLGMKGRVPQGRIELMFRLRTRNRLRVDYFATDRSGDHLLQRQIQFGDQRFDINDRATSNLDWRVFSLTYTYSFLRTDRFELGLGIALHMLEAQARGEVVAKQLRQEVSGSGAFASIPLDFTWRISRRFAFVARGQHLRATVGGTQGSLSDYHADFQYRWKPNFSVGVGYSTLKYFLAVNDASFPGEFHMDVRGPEAFFKVSF